MYWETDWVGEKKLRGGKGGGRGEGEEGQTHLESILEVRVVEAQGD